MVQAPLTEAARAKESSQVRSTVWYHHCTRRHLLELLGASRGPLSSGGQALEVQVLRGTHQSVRRRRSAVPATSGGIH